MPGPDATVVVAARDRWSHALGSLEALLAATDPRHPVVVVDGAAPASIAAGIDRFAAGDRVRVVRTSRFLASNEARNAGLDGAKTEWVAFVENDVTLSGGWLDRLIRAGEELGATTVYPAYVQPGPRGAIVHGLGAEIELAGPARRQRLSEQQHCLGEPWSRVGPELEPTERVQAEPHAIVMRREFLERIGGLDEGLLSWFEHTDLALHHRRLGAKAWLVPDVVCSYRAPPPVRIADLTSFNLRWSSTWFRRSLEHLCRVWGLDPTAPDWNAHAGYRRSIRHRVPTRSRLLNVAIDAGSEPLARTALRRWEARRESDRALNQAVRPPPSPGRPR